MNVVLTGSIMCFNKDNFWMMLGELCYFRNANINIFVGYLGYKQFACSNYFLIIHSFHLKLNLIYSFLHNL